MNYIEKFRVDQKEYLDKNIFNEGDYQTHESPSKQFNLEITNLCPTQASYEITKVEIYSQATEKLFEFLVNESQFFFGWATVGNVEYLICAEDIFGGQTVVDLTNRRMAGYSPKEDGFIWTDFYVSPNGKILATTGCYWACSTVIKLFDFSEPLNLPLPEIKEIELLDNDEVIVGWLDNETLKAKGIKREKEPEYFEGGSFRMKTLSETPVLREINVVTGAAKEYTA